MKKFLVLIFILLAATQINAQIKWRVQPKLMPYPVSGGQVVYDITGRSSYIYIFGG